MAGSSMNGPSLTSVTTRITGGASGETFQLNVVLRLSIKIIMFPLFCFF